jgi:hypothetical protein
MRTDSPTVIAEELTTLRRLERRRGRPPAARVRALERRRGRPPAARVRALRRLKGGAARSLGACAALVGPSPRQVARWWAT